MHNISLTHVRLSPLRSNLCSDAPWRSQVPFALLVMAALGLAWLA